MKYLQLILIVIFSFSLSALGMEEKDVGNLPPLKHELTTENGITLVHLTSPEKLQELLDKYPEIEKEYEKEGEGYRGDLPYFENLRNDDLGRYPFGDWFAFKNGRFLGKIELTRPDLYSGYSSIFSWILSDKRSKGDGTSIRKKIYEVITPFIGRKIKFSENDFVGGKREDQIFNGIFKGTRASVDAKNYASLISQIKTGAKIGSVFIDKGLADDFDIYYPPSRTKRI